MKIYWRILCSLLVGSLLGLMISLLSPGGNFLSGWLAASILSILFTFGLISLWIWLGKNNLVGGMMILSFVVQISLGIAVSLALPSFGYDNDHQQAGYLFKDAFLRDQAAWELAGSDKPIWTAFRSDFFADQYGGLSSLSALIYRFISPDAHRPFLILLAAAFVFTSAIPFFYDALQVRWGSKMAALAAWIFILYPEGIFYSISQMREPFLIAGGTIAFWSVLRWRNSKITSSVLFVLCMLFTLLISWTVAAAIFAVLVVWFLLENDSDVKRFLRKTPWWAYLILLLVVGLAVAVTFQWFKSSLSWDWVQAQQDSERAELEISRIGEWARIPFTLLKGVAQVVLPAAIAQPSIALWRGLTIFRSAGWYILAPLLLYGAYASFRVKNTREKRILIWLALFCMAWIFISSARGGGDLWDNPRYRTIFLPWYALLAAYGVQWARTNHDPWLSRFLLVESICLVFFTEWYLARYQFSSLIRLKFWTMIAWILGLSSLVIVGGLFWDYRKKKQIQHPDNQS